MPLRVLIVDDEPLGRQRLRALLEAEPDLEVIGECADGGSAVTALRQQRPDLIFLDVCMPELDGFGVIEALGADRPPGIIFVTAHDKFALRAFYVHALDYLLKPFDRERFHKALERARAQLAQEPAARWALAAGVSAQLRALIEDARSGKKYLDRVVIKSTCRVIFLRVEEIDWIEAAANYLKLHASQEAHLLRETMNNLETRLDPEKFLRIHRSTIVNIERIQELQPWFHGDYIVLLRDGTKLTLSRSYRQKLQELFGNAL
jgi:two-component system, LytTR family, response regulator